MWKLKTMNPKDPWALGNSIKRQLDLHMLIVDELPFKFMQREGFKKFLAATCPRFKLPSRWTLTRDCYDVYINERQSLKKFFKDHCQRVSITTDAWTSIQRINYMCMTAHFIDDQWKLHKKIISFVYVSSHKGEYIAKDLENYLLDWELRNIFSVTIDNSSSNDIAMWYLKNKFLTWSVCMLLDANICI